MKVRISIMASILLMSQIALADHDFEVQQRVITPQGGVGHVVGLSNDGQILVHENLRGETPYLYSELGNTQAPPVHGIRRDQRVITPKEGPGTVVAMTSEGKIWVQQNLHGNTLYSHHELGSSEPRVNGFRLEQNVITPNGNDGRVIAFNTDGKIWVHESLYGPKLYSAQELGNPEAPRTNGFSVGREIMTPDGKKARIVAITSEGKIWAREGSWYPRVYSQEGVKKVSTALKSRGIASVPALITTAFAGVVMAYEVKSSAVSERLAKARNTTQAPTASGSASAPVETAAAAR